MEWPGYSAAWQLWEPERLQGTARIFWSNLGPFLNSQTEAPPSTPLPSPHTPDRLPYEGHGVGFNGLGSQEPRAFLKTVPACLTWTVWEVKSIYWKVRLRSFPPPRPTTHDGCSPRLTGWLELASSIMCMSDEMLFSICGGPFKLAPLNLKSQRTR